MDKPLIIFGIIIALFTGFLIFSAVMNRAELPEPEEITANVAVIAGVEYSLDITDLSLGWTPLTGEDMKQIALLRNLTRLELKACEITDISALAGLANLTRLDLRFNEIVNITPLSNLTNLTYLNISHNEISDINALAGLSKLTTLELGGNNLSDLSPLYGDRMPALRDLYIYDNAKDDKGFHYFDEYLHGDVIKARLPNTTIHF
jgi:Leucine-rich repeat (LRR) protein